LVQGTELKGPITNFLVIQLAIVSVIISPFFKADFAFLQFIGVKDFLKGVVVPSLRFLIAFFAIKILNFDQFLLAIATSCSSCEISTGV
jgi:hypothetical protein